MCGIVGFTGIQAPGESLRVLLKEMTAALRHRGPDDEGEELVGKVGLGHRRLAIIDLSSTGHQPMVSSDGKVWIVYNGEFYDYQRVRHRLLASGINFRSTSDTEVILHLYLRHGLDFVNYIDGMFALAIYDRRSDRLILVRDRIGIKPLYYYEKGISFAFASETKPLRMLPGFDSDLDLQAIAKFLTFCYIQAPETAFSRVRQLLPGHLLIREKGRSVVKRYWTPRRVEIPKSVEECSERFDELFRQSIRRRLVADVEVGAFLSGGLDSSAIALAVSQESGAGLKTFNIRFPGEGYFDESEPARRLARAVSSDHYVEEVTPDAVAILQDIVYHYDDPYADSSAIPTMYLARMASKHVKVALSGTGADDTLAGYRRYYSERLAKRVAWLPGSWVRAVKSLLGRFSQSRRTLWGELNLLGSRFLRLTEATTEDRYLGLVSFINPQDLGTLLNSSQKDPYQQFRLLYSGSAQTDPVSKALWLDLHTYLPGDLLVKEDRATMAYGLESRVPFLDTDLVNFAVSLPVEMKMRGMTGKYILRHWAEKRLPGFVLRRKKHGFGVPISEWMREELREFGRDTLFDSNSRIGDILDPRAIKRLWNAHQQGVDHGPLLYAILILGLWLRAVGRN